MRTTPAAVKTSMKLTLIDVDMVARTVMAEAEGETYAGKVAVAAVIYNRARRPAWWGSTIIDVCITSKQFSAWNDDNPRRNKIGEWDLENPKFRECVMAAVEAWGNDPTGGADSYFAHDTVNPKWSLGLPRKIIGRHTFVRVEED